MPPPNDGARHETDLPNTRPALRSLFIAIALVATFSTGAAIDGLARHYQAEGAYDRAVRARRAGRTHNALTGCHGPRAPAPARAAGARLSPHP